MKINIGCGPVKMAGYVNIDKFPSFNPDKIMDLEKTPWDFEDNSIEEIYASHVLEHIGQTSDEYFNIVKEFYRVLKPGGVLNIRVPHPRHDNFFTDPTHVRAFTPGSFRVFSKDYCKALISSGGNTFMLAIALDVDFSLEKLEAVVEPRLVEMMNNGAISVEEFNKMSMWSNNVYSEIVVTLRCAKESQ